MNQFDEEYMARREKQIKELYELRAMVMACLVTAIILGIAAAGLLSAGYSTGGTILVVFAVLFGMGTIFMGASYFAQNGADQAIQREYELLARYEKPKRSQDEVVRLADDGELIVETELADEVKVREGRSG
jgi:hypothetical protein